MMDTTGLLEALKNIPPEYLEKLKKNMREYNHIKDFALLKNWIRRNPGNGDYEILVDNRETRRMKEINKETPFGGVVHKDLF